MYSAKGKERVTRRRMPNSFQILKSNWLYTKFVEERFYFFFDCIVLLHSGTYFVKLKCCLNFMTKLAQAASEHDLQVMVNNSMIENLPSKHSTVLHASFTHLSQYLYIFCALLMMHLIAIEGITWLSQKQEILRRQLIYNGSS